jgi:hypothetical protein
LIVCSWPNSAPCSSYQRTSAFLPRTNAPTASSKLVTQSNNAIYGCLHLKDGANNENEPSHHEKAMSYEETTQRSDHADTRTSSIAARKYARRMTRVWFTNAVPIFYQGPTCYVCCWPVCVLRPLSWATSASPLRFQPVDATH